MHALVLALRESPLPLLLPGHVFDSHNLTPNMLGLQGEKKEFGEAGQPTKVALQIYETLTALQQLKTEDPFGWVVPVV